jgi:hypothetical protein
MAVLNIDGVGDVEVDDSFLSLSPESQQQVVSNIFSEYSAGRTSGSLSPQSSYSMSDIPIVYEEPGFFGRISDVFGQAVDQFGGSTAEGFAGVGQVAGVDLPSFREFAAKNSASNIRPTTPLTGPGGVKGVGDALQTTAEYAASSIPHTGASVLGYIAGAAGTSALVGSRLPLPTAAKAIASFIGGLGGAALATFNSFLGNNIQEIRQTTGNQEVTDAQIMNAMRAAGGQALSDGIFAKLLVVKGSPQLIINMLTKGVAGVGINAPSEVTQEALQILQANDYNLDSLKTPEAKARLVEALAAGAVVGGAFGTASGARPTSEGKITEATAEVRNLEDQTALSELSILREQTQNALSPDLQATKIINDAVSAVAGNTAGGQTVNDVIDNIKTQEKDIAKALKGAAGEDAASLETQKSQLKDARQTLKELRESVRQEFNISGGDIPVGLVKENTAFSDKTAEDGIIGSLARASFTSISPMLPAAAKNNTMRNTVGLITGFFPSVKVRQAEFIRPVYNAAQKVARNLKIPIFQDQVSGRTNKILTAIIFNDKTELGTNLDPVAAQTILSRYGVSADKRGAYIEAASDLKTNNDTIFRQSVDAGLLTAEDYTPGYFHIKHDWIKKGSKGEKAAIESINKIKGMSRDKAEKIVSTIKEDINNPSDTSSASDFIYRGDVTKNVRRVAGFEKERSLPRQITEQLLKDGLISDNIFRVSTRYGQQAAHAIEMKRRFGDKTPEGKNAFTELMDSVVRLNPDDAEIRKAATTALNVHAGLQGAYNPRKVSAQTRSKLGLLMSAQFVWALSMAGFSALTEPFVTLTRLGSGDVFAGVGKAIAVMSRKFVRDIFPKFSKSVWEEEYEESIYGIDGTLSERMMASSAVDVSNLVTEKFFKLNFLTQITQFNRGIAFFAAKRMVGRDMETMSKPAVTPSEQRARKAAQTRLSEIGIKDYKNLSKERLDTAYIRLVDEVVMSPDVTNSPLWMSDPSLAWAGQLKRFTFVFGNTVVNTGFNNIFRGKTYEGADLDTSERLQRTFQYMVAFTLLTAAYELQKVLRNAIQNLDDEEKEDKRTGTRRVVDAVIGTSILGGPLSALYAAYESPKYGSDPVTSLLGPTAGQIRRVLKGLSALGDSIEEGKEPNTKALAREIIRLIPFLGANRAFRRQALAEIEGYLKDTNSNYADNLEQALLKYQNVK